MSGNYLVEHSAGSILRGAFEIYFRNFGTLFLIYLLPVLPAAILQGEAQVSENLPLLLFAVLLTLVVGLFAYGATTVAVSDVCLGNRPGFRRSYARILGANALQLLVTSLLQILVNGIGFLLLVIPGLVFTVWFMLSPAVVVLEGRSGPAALKRSKQLGDGAHWRDGGIFLLLTLVMAVVGGLIGAVFGGLFPDLLDHWVFRVVLVTVQQGVSMPLSIIALVLIYYDRRVRKEAYDAKALAEDLAR